MNSNRLFGMLIVALGLLAVGSGAALADRDGYRHHGEGHRFGDHDFDRWQRGYWHQGRHLGRFGWWWVADGVWYAYPEPVYPYPDMYTPPVVVVSPAMAPPPPPAPSRPLVSPSPQYWYYCDAAKAYYPYVKNCAAGWRQVPATPAQ